MHRKWWVWRLKLTSLNGTMLKNWLFFIGNFKCLLVTDANSQIIQLTIWAKGEEKRMDGCFSSYVIFFWRMMQNYKGCNLHLGCFCYFMDFIKIYDLSTRNTTHLLKWASSKRMQLSSPINSHCWLVPDWKLIPEQKKMLTHLRIGQNLNRLINNSRITTFIAHLHPCCGLYVIKIKNEANLVY